MDLLLRVINCRIAPTCGVMTAGTRSLIVLAMTLIRGLVYTSVYTSLVKMLLVPCSPCCISWTTTILVADTAIFRRGSIVMTGSVPFRPNSATDHMGCLGRTSFDLICREFFQVSDARLKSLNGLPLANIAI